MCDDAQMFTQFSSSIYLSRVVRIKELTQLLGLSRSTIYDRLNPKSKRYDPSFPKPIKIGASPSAAIGWRLDGVMLWIETLSQ